jgi:hypothetical protein
VPVLCQLGVTRRVRRVVHEGIRGRYGLRRVTMQSPNSGKALTTMLSRRRGNLLREDLAGLLANAPWRPPRR